MGKWPDTVTPVIPTGRMTLLIAVVLSLCAGCYSPEKESVPPALIGHWVTEAPGYEMCYTEITHSTIDFFTAERTLREYTLEGVKRTVKVKNEVSHDVLDIHYSDRDGEDYLLTVVLDEDGGHHRLRFFHQPHLVWMKGE